MIPRSSPDSHRKSHARPLTLALMIGGSLVLMLVLVAANVLGGREPGIADSPGDTSDPQLARGEQIYRAQCASCHGVALEGQPGWQNALPGGVRLAPPLDASGPSWQRSDDYLFAITADGGQRFVEPGTVSTMPGYAAILSDAEIDAVLEYIKSTWPPEIRAAQEQLPATPTELER